MKDFLFLFFVMVGFSVLSYFIYDRELSEVLINILVLTIPIGVVSFIKYFLVKRKDEKDENFHKR